MPFRARGIVARGYHTSVMRALLNHPGTGSRMRLEPSNNFFQGLLEWGRRVTAPQQAPQVSATTETSSQTGEVARPVAEKTLRPVGTRGAHLDIYA